MNKQAGDKRQRIRRRLMNAFIAYRNNEPGSMDRLLVVVREFAYMKMYHLEYEFKDFGTADTVDDWAQEVMITVWQELPRLEVETPALFYSWLHKVVFNRDMFAFNSLLKEQSQRVGLTIMVEGEDGVMEEVDNPEIYASRGYDSSFALPKSITGTNRDICNLLLSEINDGDGGRRTRTYAEVAEIVGMTEAAVKMRLSRMRDKFKR